MNVEFLERDGFVLAMAPEAPAWAAVNRLGARALEVALDGNGRVPRPEEVCRRLETDEIACSYVPPFLAELRELKLIGQPEAAPYEGRAAYLWPARLNEIWFHINNRCNFACKHCLVSSGPRREDGLPPGTMRDLARQARELGAQVFYFTGGEPLLRDDLPALLHEIVAELGATAVVLTNGAFLTDAWLDRLDLDGSDDMYFQVSLDGATPETNDALRSHGSFKAATGAVRTASRRGFATSVATVVLSANLEELEGIARVAHEAGADSMHLMWQHFRERGLNFEGPALDELIGRVMQLRDYADSLPLDIDNFEALRQTVNGEPHVKRDMTNACWDSLAVYVDGAAYPSAALVNIPEFAGKSAVETSLQEAWLDSDVFVEYRSRSMVVNGYPDGDPLAFFHGGGDPEHAYFRSCAEGTERADPYLKLYEAMMLRVMDEVVRERMALWGRREDVPFVYHVMGDDGEGCPIAPGVGQDGPHQIDFNHSNCVLITDVIQKARGLVRDYYGEAAEKPKSEICSPVQMDRRYLEAIPQEVLERSYGCGSPVFVATIGSGHTVVDLGAGAGIECFIASQMVGPEGIVIGVDMTPQMLEVADRSRKLVSESIGYDNVRFVSGYLERIPLAASTVDRVLSNCVINLSPQKLKVFHEARRVLRPGGKMVISDIVAEREVPHDVKFNPRLKGECVGGALTEEKLLRTLAKLGFVSIKVLAKSPWREEQGVQFYSLTWEAQRPESADGLTFAEAMYEVEEVVEGEHEQGCRVCGAELVYLPGPAEMACYRCGRTLRTRARCENGHFVCDQCHGGDYQQFLRSFSAQCELTDPIEVFRELRQNYPFPVHGPEHHALVPVAFLTAYRNLTDEITQEAVEEGLRLGAALPGGTCAFWGGCAAALGMGIAYSLILDATPLKAPERNVCQDLVAEILQRIAGLGAARCCQRESYLSLAIACKRSGEHLPHAIESGEPPPCDQVWLNSECLGAECPYAPGQGE